MSVQPDGLDQVRRLPLFLPCWRPVVGLPNVLLFSEDDIGAVSFKEALMCLPLPQECVRTVMLGKVWRTLTGPSSLDRGSSALCQDNNRSRNVLLRDGATERGQICENGRSRRSERGRTVVGVDRDRSGFALFIRKHPATANNVVL